MYFLLAFLLTTVPCLCSATSLHIDIPPSVHLSSPDSLSPATYATLFSSSSLVAPHSTALTVRSTLEFQNLTIPESPLGPQSFLLSISAPSHVFASYRVDLIPDGSRGQDGMGAQIEGVWETYLGSPWSDRGPILAGKAALDGQASGIVGGSDSLGANGRKQEQVVRIEAKVLSRREFYQKRPGFNPLGLLMNPMLLLGIVALGVTFGMPYLMDNMDPELRAEFEDQKSKGPLSGMHKAIQDATSGGGGAPGSNPGGGAGVGNFDLASWMAGSQSKTQSTTSGTDVREGGKRRR